mgnify:CR=1 FL=1
MLDEIKTIIIDIFASRAITREAVLQVELARMKYYLPRLARAWTHLSRQRGGAKGTRGEGETQIEVDRRMIKREISQLTKELEEVRKQRSTQRKLRERSSVLHCAIVGYTNVGKSSILRALSGAGVLVEDKLFATLDPTTRKITLPNNQKLLLTDTVGFVRDLPHDLVEAFKSTLEEAVLSDFLMLVLDISSPIIFEQWETTLQVLHELGAEDKNILVVLNKIDRPGAQPYKVVDDVLELFIELGANDEQLEFPVVYASGKQGTATLDLDKKGEDLKCLFETIISHIGAPECDMDGTMQMLVSNIDYDDYIGRIAIGRVERGAIDLNMPIAICKDNDKIETARVTKLYVYEGLKRVEVEHADAGDIVALSGVTNINIGDTICDYNNPEKIPFVDIDEPTVSMTFSVNNGPFAGKEGKFLTPVTADQAVLEVYDEIYNDTFSATATGLYVYYDLNNDGVADEVEEANAADAKALVEKVWEEAKKESSENTIATNLNTVVRRFELAGPTESEWFSFKQKGLRVTVISGTTYSNASSADSA